MSEDAKTNELEREIDDLTRRLEEAEEALRAIRSGEVDALYVDGPDGQQLFTLRGADHTYRTLVEEMSQGALTTTADGIVLYANRAFADMVGMPHERIVGASLTDCIAPVSRDLFAALLGSGTQKQAGAEVELIRGGGGRVPAYVSLNPVSLEGEQVICMAVTDLTRQQQQQEMVRAERLSRAVLESAGEAILVCDTQGRIVRANQAAQALAGRDVLLQPCDEVLPLQVPADSAGAPEAFSVARMLAGESLHRVEAVLQDNSAQPRYLLLSATPLRSDAVILGCVLVLTDTTVQKQLELELAAERERLSVTLLSIGDGVIVCDLDGRVVEINRVAEALTGWIRAEALGEPLETVFTIVNEHTRVPCENPVRKVLQEGEIVGLANDTVLIARDGMQRIIADSGAPILRRDNHIIGVVLVFRDITESRAAEKALLEREREYAQLLQNLPGMVYRCRNDRGWTMQFLSAGAAAVTGYSPEDLIDNQRLSFNDLIVPEYRAFVWEQWQEVLDRRGFFEEEYPIRTADGQEKWVWERGRGVYDDSGELLFLEGYIQDVTERKNMEEHLRQSQKMEAMGTLAGGIAHDFNNIIGGILGYAEVAREDLQEGLSVAEHLEEIVQLSVRARDLTAQILTFSRKTTQEQTPMHLQPLVKETLKMLRATTPSTITIDERIDDTAGMVAANPTQVHQLVMNLCTNAVHAMEQTGGTLEVALSAHVLDRDTVMLCNELPPGTYVRLRISDTGAGIGPDVRCRVFEPFFTTKQKGKGTGMGLSVVHGIVQNLGGGISLQSAPGRGSTFSVLLPVAESRQPPQTPVAAAGPPPGTVQARILFVDDETVLVEVARRMLSSLGHTVTAVCDSTEALEIFRRDPQAYDLVITDQTMPRMTGFALAREMLRIRAGLPVILCTGFSEAVSEETVKAAGIREFIYKPLDKQKFTRAIHAVLTGCG